MNGRGMAYFGTLFGNCMVLDSFVFTYIAYASFAQVPQTPVPVLIGRLIFIHSTKMPLSFSALFATEIKIVVILQNKSLAIPQEKRMGRQWTTLR